MVKLDSPSPHGWTGPINTAQARECRAGAGLAQVHLLPGREGRWPAGGAASGGALSGIDDRGGEGAF